MNQRCIKKLDEEDWETILLEVGTAKTLEGLGEEAQLINKAIYPALSSIAYKWLNKRHLNTNQVQDLVSIAFQSCILHLVQFTPPDASSKDILKAFKAWAIKLAINEWKSLLAKDVDRDMVSYEDFIDVPSNADSDFFSNALNDCLKQVLYEELDALHGNIKECLLALAQVKNSTQQNVRGLKNESKQIVELYGYKPDAVRKQKSRLFTRVKERADKECK